MQGESTYTQSIGRISYEDCIEAMTNLSSEQARFYFQEAFKNPDNISVFGKFFFPNMLTSAVPSFHEELYREFLADKDSAVAAPRDHAKSTVMGIVVMWLIINRQKRFIVYVGQTHEKTVQFLEPVRNEFKENRLLQWVYGDLTPHSVRDSGSNKDRNDCFDAVSTRLQAVSFEKNLRGFRFGTLRPDLIVLDDIETDDRVTNPALRTADSNKFSRIIIASLDSERNGRVKMIGTILNAESLLVQRIRVTDGKIYRAINPDGSLLWPGRWTIEKLQERKKQMGTSGFEAEYMNNPIDNELSVIKAEWVRSCFDHELSYKEASTELKFDFKYLGVDFAFSERAYADKSAYVGIGCKEGLNTLFSIVTKTGLSITQQFDYLNMYYEMNKINDIAMEENSIRSMSKELINYKFHFTLYWTAATDEKAKIKPTIKDIDFEGKRHTVGKKALIFRMATLFENGKIVIPYKTENDKMISNQLLDELITFGVKDGKLVETGVHSDIGMALAFALERACSDDFAWTA